MTAKPMANTSEPSGAKERLRLWLKLLKTSRSIEDQLRRRLRNELGSTLPRFDVMSALDRAPDGLKMSEISKRLRVSNGNITGIVDKLTEEGLVLRVAVPGDRRANLVRLTSKGRDVFADHARAHEAWINQIMGGLGEGEAHALVTQLSHLAETLERQDDAD